MIARIFVYIPAGHSLVLYDTNPTALGRALNELEAHAAAAAIQHGPGRHAPVHPLTVGSAAELAGLR